MNAIPIRRGCTLKQALGDGEDYEEEFPRVPLTAIGSLVDEETEGPVGGWDHFGGE